MNEGCRYLIDDNVFWDTYSYVLCQYIYIWMFSIWNEFTDNFNSNWFLNKYHFHPYRYSLKEKQDCTWTVIIFFSFNITYEWTAHKLKTSYDAWLQIWSRVARYWFLYHWRHIASKVLMTRKPEKKCVQYMWNIELHSYKSL